jgi:hypothetical protein
MLLSTQIFAQGGWSGKFGLGPEQDMSEVL